MSNLIETGESRDRGSNFPARIRQWLSRSVLGAEQNDHDVEIKKRQKRRLILLSMLLIAVAAYLRSARRQKRLSLSSPVPNSMLQPSSRLWPVGLLIAWWKGPEYSRNPQQSTLNLLYTAAKEGLIRHAMISDDAIYFSKISSRGNDKHVRWNRTALPANNESIKSGLLETLAAGGCEDIQAIPESLGSKLSTPILAALPFVYLALLYRMFKSQFGGDDISSKLTNATRQLWGEHEEAVRTTFRDVAGLPSAVEDLSEVVSYLSNPSLYNTMGARPPRGVLLHGPPGGGKTLLARAVAGEAKCDSFTALSGSSFVEMYVGRGAARVRALFQQARRDALRRRALKKTAYWWSSLLGMSSPIAQERPACAILFIDELDAVAKLRSYDGVQGNDEREQTLNQLLTEMDGFDTAASKERDNDKDDVTLIVIAASNRVDVIDPAILRRFDRQIFVDYPNSEGRKDILRIHAGKISCSSSVDWDELSSDAYTENFSGADLRNLINEAALFAVREKNQLVEQRHLLHAARRIRGMKERTSSGRNAGQTMLPAFFTSID